MHACIMYRLLQSPFSKAYWHLHEVTEKLKWSALQVLYYVS